MLLYLNDIYPWIKPSYIWRNMWNLILWKEPVNNCSSCFDDYKSGAFIPVHPAQHFNMQPHFGMLYPKIREGKWYDDT